MIKNKIKIKNQKLPPLPVAHEKIGKTTRETIKPSPVFDSTVSSSATKKSGNEFALALSKALEQAQATA